MKKVIIAVDSFKGSLSSLEVAEAFEQGFRSICPDCEVRKVAIADGGEGTVEALVETLGGEYIDVEVCDPLHRPIKARYGIIDGGKTAVIEMSAASGLTLLKVEERNPLLTSTYGTGEMVADAISRGCRKILMGIGGSATNDAGTGMFRALGYRFFDGCGEELVGGGEILERIVDIDDSNVIPELAECKFIVACDVTNRLFGKFGAAYVFAPQKVQTRLWSSNLTMDCVTFRVGLPTTMARCCHLLRAEVPQVDLVLDCSLLQMHGWCAVSIWCSRQCTSTA